MDRIINLIEAELKRQEETIRLQSWEIDSLNARLKDAEEELELYRGKRTPIERDMKANG